MDLFPPNPYGVAKFDLKDILMGKNKLNLTAFITPGPSGTGKFHIQQGNWLKAMSSLSIKVEVFYGIEKLYQALKLPLYKHIAIVSERENLIPGHLAIDSVLEKVEKHNIECLGIIGSETEQLKQLYAYHLPEKGNSQSHQVKTI
jgi:hypothetical protein